MVQRFGSLLYLFKELRKKTKLLSMTGRDVCGNSVFVSMRCMGCVWKVLERCTASVCEDNRCGVGCMSGVGRLKYALFTVENYMSHYKGHGYTS